MAKNNLPVVVSYNRLSKAITKALEANPNSIAEAPQTPVPAGYEAFESSEPPATPEESPQWSENLSRSLKLLEREQGDMGILTAPNDQFTSLLQSRLAEVSLQEDKVEPAAGGGLEAQFDEHDILGWAKSIVTWIKKIRPHKWQTALPIPDLLPNTTRVAILGDWGTGLYGAPECAKSIENDPRPYGLLLHLGDVYYSGTDREVAERFLGLWPRKSDAVSRACNSNHEMYTGGYAYFDQTLRHFNEPASYFALQNDHWLLVGLDSAYKEWHLYEGQVEWFKGLLATAGGRRVILFSHHQLFSWMETAQPKMQSELGELLTDQRIFAWYWGHEHRCVLYDRHPVWGLYGRCVGHSGYPYFRDSISAGTVVANGRQDSTLRKVDMKNMVPGGLILEGPNIYIEGHENQYGPNGYMTLELNGDRINEVVQMPDGSIVWERELG